MKHTKFPYPPPTQIDRVFDVLTYCIANVNERVWIKGAENEYPGKSGWVYDMALPSTHHHFVEVDLRDEFEEP